MSRVSISASWFLDSDILFLMSGSWFQVSGIVCFRVPGFGFRVSGFGFRVSGLRFRVSGFWWLVLFIFSGF